LSTSRRKRPRIGVTDEKRQDYLEAIEYMKANLGHPEDWYITNLCIELGYSEYKAKSLLDIVIRAGRLVIDHKGLFRNPIKTQEKGIVLRERKE